MLAGRRKPGKRKDGRLKERDNGKVVALKKLATMLELSVQHEKGSQGNFYSVPPLFNTPKSHVRAEPL